MAYLIQHLLLPLLAIAAFGAVAGWCWHCIRNKARLDDLLATRARLRMEYAGLVQGPTGLRGLGPDPELEAANMRTQVAVARVLELERLQADILADRDNASARVNELEMALAAAKAASQGQDWSTRFAALENERDAALRELDDARTAWNTERASLLSAPAPDLQEALPDVETRAQAWRVRLLEGRTEFLESRLQTERAVAEREDPRLSVLTQKNATQAIELEQLRAQIAERESRAIAPAIPVSADNDVNLLRWQSRYLGERVKYLEDQIRHAAPPQAVAVMPQTPAIDVEALNRRAWRQRYLEARLSYYEGRWREDRAGRITATGELAERAARFEALDREHTDLRGAAEQARARIAELEGQMAQLRQEREATLDAQKASSAELQGLRAQLSDLDPLKSEIARLQMALNAARNDAAARDDLARELAAVKAQISERDADIARLKNTTRPQVDETEVMHLRFRTRYLDDRVKFLEARLAAQPSPKPAAAPRQTFLPSQPSATEVRPMALPAARSGAPDDLRLIDGVSPRIESTLNSIGVYHFDQIAAWTDENVAWVERYLAYKGRIVREHWVDQARGLADGEDLERVRRFREDEQV